MDKFTYFKAVYHRYTYFSKESVEESFSSDPIPGSSISCKLSKVGDVVKNMHLYLEVNVDDPYFLGVDDMLGARYERGFVDNFVAINTDKLNIYLNSIQNITDYEYLADTMSYLGIGDIFATVLNYQNDGPVPSSDINQFVVNIDIVNEIFTNEFNYQDDIEIKFTSDEFLFSEWQYFKFFHFYELFLKLNELELVRNSDENLRRTKKEEFNRLEIHNLLDLKKRFDFDEDLYFRICSEFSLFMGRTLVSKYDNHVLKFFADHVKNIPDHMSSPRAITRNGTICLYIPLLFFDGVFFPVIATRYDDIEIRVDISDVSQLIRGEKPSLVSIRQSKLFVDYFFLNNMERDLFLKTKIHLFLPHYETISKDLSSSNEFTIVHLDFDSCSKYLFWFLKTDTHYFGESFDDPNPRTKLFELFFDNESLCKKIGSVYFRLCQAWQRFSNYSKQSNFWMYSFSLFPCDTKHSSFIDFKNFKSKFMIVNSPTNYSSDLSLYVISCGFRVVTIDNGRAVLNTS